jgi:hypothetical protein
MEYAYGTDPQPLSKLAAPQLVRVSVGLFGLPTNVHAMSTAVAG